MITVDIRLALCVTNAQPYTRQEAIAIIDYSGLVAERTAAVTEFNKQSTARSRHARGVVMCSTVKTSFIAIDRIYYLPVPVLYVTYIN